MQSNIKKPRKRINRFARILAEIYNEEYATCLKIYNNVVNQNESVSFKMQLSAAKYRIRMNKVGIYGITI